MIIRLIGSIVVVNDDFLFSFVFGVFVGFLTICLNVLRWNVTEPSTKEENCWAKFGCECKIKHVSAEARIIVQKTSSGFVARLLPQNTWIVNKWTKYHWSRYCAQNAYYNPLNAQCKWSLFAVNASEEHRKREERNRTFDLFFIISFGVVNFLEKFFFIE